MTIQPGHKTVQSNRFNKLCAFISVGITAFTFYTVGAVSTVETGLDSAPYQTTFREKVESYKRFKAKYEDKDFALNRYPVRRVEHTSAKSEIYFFDIYHITYGIIADNIKEYGKSRRQIVQHPTNSRSNKEPGCRSRRYVEDYHESNLHPKIACLEDAERPYPVALILSTLSDEELDEIAVIYEFNDGDLDIHFSMEKASDKKFVERLAHKLIRADEKNDEKRQAVKMQPIMPTINQRIAISYLDEDKDGERDFVLIPYCIDGSYFDDDPANNAIQVALKYKLITRKDLSGRTPAEKVTLEKRMGLWMWDTPVEIWASFCDHPGPDIVFYDIGKVVDDKIVDSRPDGEFDRYKFLF